jgi:hypothetical protein
VKREIFVHAAEARDEVILEGPNRTFCGIATVDVGGDELIVDLLDAHELLI